MSPPAQSSLTRTLGNKLTESRQACVAQGDAQAVNGGNAAVGPHRMVFAEDAGEVEAGAGEDVRQMLARRHERVDASACEMLDHVALVRVDASAERRGDVAEREDARAEPQREG